MEKWRVIDNMHEKILNDDFETEKEAEDFVIELIKGHRERKENYDYDVALLEDGTTYEQYIASIED